MKKIVILLNLLCAFYFNSLAQTTYTWNVTRGDWNSPSSWSPARNTPAANDILVFNGSTIPNACATLITTQTIGKLRIINNANVRFIAKAPTQATGTISRASGNVTGSSTLFTTELKQGDVITNGNTFYGEVSSITSNTAMVVTTLGTLTNVPFYFAQSLNLSDGTTSALDISSGSVLTMSDSTLVIRILNGSKGSVNGTVRMLNARQRIHAMDSLGLIVGSTGKFITDSSFVGNPFTQVGGSHSVVFSAGASFQFYIGSNPFALSAPGSKVLFQPGSYYYHYSTGSPSISGRTYANFVCNTTGNVSGTQNSTLYIDTFVLQQGQFNLTISNIASVTSFNTIQVDGGVLNFNQKDGNTKISGDISVASGAKLILQGKYTTTPTNFLLNGTSPQKITAAGQLIIANKADSSIELHIQNPSGVTLQSDIQLNFAKLHMDSGFINLNNKTLTLGNSTTHGRATQLNGYIKGAGNITRWYLLGAVGEGDSSLFPVGGTGGTYPAWVFGSVTGTGTVTLSNFTENPGVFSFSTPFTDAAPISGSITVNSRFGHSWSFNTANGLAGTAFTTRVKVNTNSGYVTDVTKMRLTLASGIAPGNSEDGGGTLLKPSAGKNALTLTQLSNTFYMGSNTSSNPLDILFKEIKVYNAGNKNVVAWKTAQELNISHFIVERNTNGTFEKVANVTAQNNKLGASYLFNDNYSECALYRVIAISIDGSENYSQIGVIDCNENKLLQVYPNPAVDKVTITDSSVSAARIYNSFGKEFEMQLINNEINLQNLLPGVYYLQLNTNSGLKIIKLIKQ